MTKPEVGKHIISAAKSLKRYQLGNVQIAGLLYGASQAGRAGLFASALRNAGRISLQRAEILAAQEGFSPRDVESILLPWLEAAGLAFVPRKDGAIQRVESLVLKYESLLVAVADLYESLRPTAEDRGCLLALDWVSRLPMPESQVRHKLAKEIGEEKAAAAISLAKNFRIVSVREGKGLAEPVLFSERVWTKFSLKNAHSLSPLDAGDRAVLVELVDRVRNHQGIPEVLLANEAGRLNALHLLKLAIGVGLVNRTEIKMVDGARRAFLTTPHFYADMGDEFGQDVCDRVKIFLDSIRNGQHFGSAGTGRILSPAVLLEKLLNTGVIGPCTAISTDYVTSELAGIVRVKRSINKPGQAYLHLVQRDTVGKVHQVITSGSVVGSGNMEASHVREGVGFASIEQMRPEAGDVPEELAEVERAIILKLRES